MPKQQELDQCYMNIALEMAKLSKAQRKKVGAVILTKQGIIIPACNGMPSGMSNICEDAMWNTKNTCIHAERNAIIKAAREGVSIVDSILYVTTSCCEQCAAMVIQSGVKEAVYLELYRDTSGIDFLKEAGIVTRQITLEK